MTGMTDQELRELPVAVDVGTAARALGVSRSTGYDLARRNAFPCRVIRVGSTMRLPRSEIFRLLGLGPSPGLSAGEAAAPMTPLRSALLPAAYATAVLLVIKATLISDT
jgi:excisionase family DNA binding protein